MQPAEKILLVRVDEIGAITVNGDTVGSNILARYIQERLFKSYLGTGQMHARIKLEKVTADVTDLITEAIASEIKEAQKRALTEVCLEKYRKTFLSLEKRQQDKLKKLFPVLFQTDYL
ncbi:MAG: hypothetical protein ABJA85_03075 [Bacteroidota bacterium]